MTPLQYALFWAALAALFLAPGFLLARHISLLWQGLSRGERFLPAFLLSAAILALVYLLSLSLLPTLNFALMLWAGILFALALSGLRLHWREKRSGPGTGEGRPRMLAPPGSKGANLAALLVVLATGIAMLGEGGSLGYIHDSLDFVAFVRRILETGRIDLDSGSYKLSADLSPDPRRGAFHLGAALLCRLSGVAPDHMWRVFPSFLVPISLWVFYASFRRLLQSAPVALLSLLFFLIVSFFSGDHFLNNLAYASRLGWVYSWVGLWAVALFLDAIRAEKTPPQDWTSPTDHSAAAGPRGSRARSALLLVVAAGPVLVGIHILSALQYLVSLAAFCWVWAFSPNEPRPVRRTLLRLPLLVLAAIAPFLLLQLVRTYSTANPIFDHPQGLLYLWDDWAVLAPSHLSDWFGWPGLLGCLLALPFTMRALDRRDFAFFAGSTLLPAFILLNPLAVRVTEAAGAHSMLFRVLLVVPYFQVLGFYAFWSARRFGRERGIRPLLGPSLFVLLVAILLSVHVRNALRFWGTPAARRAAWRESQPLEHAFDFLEASVADPRVIASDPITSYQIPAYTKHYVITPFNQHSSPADARAVERIHDAHAILNAFVPIDETLRLLRKHEVELLVLNQSFPRYVKYYYTFISPLAYTGQREKFLRRPTLFERIYERDGIWIFRVHDPGSDFRGDTLDLPNPHLVVDAETSGTNRFDPALYLAQPLTMPATGGIQPLGIQWDSTSVRRGGFLKVVTYWRRSSNSGELPVEAFLRLETAFPHRLYDSPLLGKVYRRVYESRHGETHRFGRFYQPLETHFPADLWEPGTVYRDEWTLPIPAHAHPGIYKVRLKLLEQPYTPNFHLRDYLSNQDSLQGILIGEIRVYGS